MKLKAADEIGEDPDSACEKQMPRERDGSDADEAFEDQAVEMDSTEVGKGAGFSVWLQEIIYFLPPSSWGLQRCSIYRKRV